MNLQELARWRSNNGELLRITYPVLEEKSSCVVFDVGGFKGEFSEKIIQKYPNCLIYIFEPVKQFYDEIVLKFKNNPSIKVFHFGLADKSGTSEIMLQNDGTSRHVNSSNKETIQLVSFKEFIEKEKIDQIDLCKINIEGDEYPLLNHMIDTNVINVVKNIQVQFHDFYPNAKQEMEQLHNKLLKTHKSTFYYEFVWEGWTLLDKNDITNDGWE